MCKAGFSGIMLPKPAFPLKDKEKIWRHSYNGREEQDLPNPKASVEKMAQFTLQTFSTPAMYINHPGCAVPVASVCTTGVKMDSSNSSCPRPI
ncbi:Actin, cytoplasmic 1 [Microtus ochrogaster]|uniref:Actin, cytoplasmic 1 n=1 Tax=Microtus ochrogaster TaxID=79684 RepID=A0A8J6H1S5_MICOH|nr:Actin, cytoplasmic 1 [Microtus ochrogaster]